MGLDDFTDWVEQGTDVAGNLVEGATELQSNALHGLGFDGLADTVNLLGESNQFVLQTVGNFATPVFDVVPTAGDYAADSLVAFSDFANGVAHGDPDAFDDLNDAGERINNETWDKLTDSFADAGRETGSDFGDYLHDAHQVDPSLPADPGELADGYEKLWDQITQVADDDGASGPISAPLANLFGSSAEDGASSDGAGVPGGLLGGIISGAATGAMGGGSGAWQGMDVEAVEAAARQLQEMAQRTTRLVAKVDGEVSDLGANWNGVDSQRYVQQWQGQYKAVLTKSAKLLESMSQDALQQVATQRHASGH
jgi:uncharacterized protein YukE